MLGSCIERRRLGSICVSNIPFLWRKHAVFPYPVESRNNGKAGINGKPKGPLHQYIVETMPPTPLVDADLIRTVNNAPVYISRIFSSRSPRVSSPVRQ
jgi:hypothetical protein